MTCHTRDPYNQLFAFSSRSAVKDAERKREARDRVSDDSLHSSPCIPRSNGRPWRQRITVQSLIEKRGRNGCFYSLLCASAFSVLRSKSVASYQRTITFHGHHGSRIQFTIGERNPRFEAEENRKVLNNKYARQDSNLRPPA